MKICYFNLNYGRNDFDGVIEFVKNNLDFDVFCFQEAKNEICLKLDSILENYNKSLINKEIEGFGSFNLKTYLNKKYQNFSFEVFEDNFENTAPFILLKIVDENSNWNILNFHGSPQPGDKLDNEIRINTTKKIISIMSKTSGAKIIGGDFNLLPNTRSIEAFENFGYKNLIKDFKIKTTRNENAWKLYDNKQLFADYIFVSKETDIKKFEVIENKISDHLPMMLEL